MPKMSLSVRVQFETILLIFNSTYCRVRLFRIIMSDWADNLPLDYNLDQKSHQYFPILDDYNDEYEPTHNALTINLDYFANNLSEKKQHQVTTGIGIPFLKVFSIENSQLQPQEKLFSPSVSNYEKKEEGPVVNKNRDSVNCKSQIEFSDSFFWKRSVIEKGERFQTKNLSKNLHTETSNYLKKRAMANMFSKDEMDMLRAFCGGSFSLDNFKTLFKNEKFRILCRQYYQSKFFVQQIFSSKMDMKTKINMIKYLNKIFQLTYDYDFKSWKQDKYFP